MRTIFREAVAQRLREGAVRPDVLEFVALFLLGARRIGIGDANIPERIFGKHYAERFADRRLQGLPRLEDFHIQLFALGKGRILHDAIENDSRDLRRITGHGIRPRSRFLRQCGHSRQKNNNASI